MLMKLRSPILLDMEKPRISLLHLKVYENNKNTIYLCKNSKKSCLLQGENNYFAKANVTIQDESFWAIEVSFLSQSGHAESLAQKKRPNGRIYFPWTGSTI